LAVAAWLLLGAVSAQPPSLPPIETIDFYGLRTRSASDVRALLPFAEGDVIERPPDSLAAEIAAALGIARVELSAVCCTAAGRTQLYVGVEEQPRTSLYRDAPTGDVMLPGEIMASVAELDARLREAVLSGQAREDWSAGHALAEYAPVREIQQRFLAYAAAERDLLVEVLRNSASAAHRAAAALVLGYAPDKSSVTPELVRAVLDADDGVRNNATRALAVIAAYAGGHPELGIEIDAEPFVAMLDSVVWSDRNKALALLAQLTQSRPPALLASLRERSGPALREVCGWQSFGHAMSACLILQRVAGLPDDPSVESREATLARALVLSE
jgi:hypothetical protein